MIVYFHTKVLHQGTNYMLNKFRQDYWIPAGRASVSSVTCACVVSKRYTTRPFKQPDNSNLPSFQSTLHSSSFDYIGVDTCGPLIVSGQKYYVLIVVDLICRAIDLEVLIDMTAQELFYASELEE